MAPQLTYTMFPARCSCYDGIVSSESCVFHGHLDIGSETAGLGVVESAQSRGDIVTITVERTSLFVVSLGAQLLTSPLPLAETKIRASASVRFSARKIHFFFPRPALAKIASTCCLLRPLPVHTTGTCDQLQTGSKPCPASFFFAASRFLLRPAHNRKQMHENTLSLGWPVRPVHVNVFPECVAKGSCSWQAVDTPPWEGL